MTTLKTDPSPQKVPCPCCLTSASLVALRSHTSAEVTYRLYQCAGCAVEFWDPRRLEPTNYEAGCYWGSAVMHLGMSPLPRYTQEFFKSFPISSGRLLDIGCGDGVFLDETRRLGFETWGIDLDSAAVRAAKEVRGLQNVAALTLDEFKASSPRPPFFDAVTFFEVLEHQAFPIEFLETARSLLRPDAWIAGSVPNRRAPFNNFHRRYYFDSILPPHHFLWFDESSLRSVLERSGFVDVRIVGSHRLARAETAMALQGLFLGRFFHRIKRRAREFAVGPQRSTHAHAGGQELSPRRYKQLAAVRQIVSVVSLPAVLIAERRYNAEPQGLYFMARKPASS